MLLKIGINYLKEPMAMNFNLWTIW